LVEAKLVKMGKWVPVHALRTYLVKLGTNTLKMYFFDDTNPLALNPKP